MSRNDGPNLDKHGIDGADIAPEFFLGALVKPARDGRWIAIGEHHDVIVGIFATLGGEAISIISARPPVRRKGSCCHDQG